MSLKSGTVRSVGGIASAVLGLWAGAAVPLFLFLLTGIPLVPLLVGALAVLSIAIMANERRGPRPARAWLRTLCLGAACGVAFQALFTLLGGWSFGA